MENKDLSKKLDELNETLEELNSFLEKYKDQDDFYEEDVENYNVKDEFEDGSDNEFDENFADDLNDTCGISVGFDISKLLDPRYNEHILSEPDENGMVEISDELYDSLYGKYHSKEDMLSDIISELEYYISGKLAGDKEYWSEIRYLGINRESNRPRIGTMSELEEDNEVFDIYDIDEFEKCYCTNVDDINAECYDYKLIDDSAIRKLIDKYYPNLSW